jgi:Spy/CpxP family protein refolding chaperone
MGPGGPGDFVPMILGRLDLSQDQRDRVKQIFDSHKDEQKALADRAMTAHEALDDAVTSVALDEGLVRTRAEAVAAVDVDRTLAQARIYSEVFQILTADQQTKLKTLQTELKARRARMKANRAA